MAHFSNTFLNRRIPLKKTPKPNQSGNWDMDDLALFFFCKLYVKRVLGEKKSLGKVSYITITNIR